MKKTLIIDGGLGRTVASIPALEKFVNNNPDSIIIANYWTQIFWGNKLLTDCVFDSNTKGLFDRVKNTKIIKPEPYYNSNFLNERINMIQAFDEELNEDIGNLKKPSLYFSNVELATSRNIIDKNKKTIFIQPFSSTANFIGNELIDNTSRSLKTNSVNVLLDFLNKNNYQTILFDTKNAIDKNRYQNIDDMNFRMASAVLAQCDYFIGIDSCCNHLGYALEIPGTTFFGGSSVKNYGYEDWFKIIKPNDEVKYYPFRLCEFDAWLSEIQNTDLLNYTENEMLNYCEEILEDIKEKT